MIDRGLASHGLTGDDASPLAMACIEHCAVPMDRIFAQLAGTAVDGRPDLSVLSLLCLDWPAAHKSVVSISRSVCARMYICMHVWRSARP